MKKERHCMGIYTVYETHMTALMLQFALMFWIEYPRIKLTGGCPLEYRLQHPKQ